MRTAHSIGSRVKYGLLIALSLAGLWAAAPHEGKAQTAAAPTATIVPDRSYRLGPGDRLRITVFNEPTLSGEFAVSTNGGVSLPLVGEVKAVNLTVDEFKQAATAAFGAGYLNSPNLSVEVLTYRPFYILGEVNKPGEYPYAAGMTVLKAVASANGFTYRGDTKTVMIKHEDEEQEHRVKLDPTTPVRPGDTIRVRERFF